MKCAKCGSENVNVQVVNEVTLKNKHKGVIYWLFIGWWLQPIIWICFTLPALLVAVFGHKKQKAVNKQVTKCVCQACGYTWNA